MNIDMGSLALGMLSAVFFGALMWVLSAVLVFLSMLFFGISRRADARREKVRHEVFLCLFAVFATLAAVVFLYAVNRGVYRWFLFLGMLGGFIACRHTLGGTARGFGEKTAEGVRHAIKCGVYWMTFPLRVFVRAFYRIFARIYRKIYLRAHDMYDKINIKNYNRKMREHIGRSAGRELDALCRSQNL